MSNIARGHPDRDCMVVGFIITYAISAYHHQRCAFESREGKMYSIQHYGQFYWWKKPLTCRKSYNAVSNTSCLLGIRMHNVGDDRH
jgi:hypothetical protein